MHVNGPVIENESENGSGVCINCGYTYNVDLLLNCHSCNRKWVSQDKVKSLLGCIIKDATMEKQLDIISHYSKNGLIELNPGY